MTPNNRNNSTNGHQTSAGLSLEDVYFTLFRHKWLILGFCCLGVAGAVAVRVLRPPLYMSVAKLMVQNVTLSVKSAPGEEGHMLSTQTGAQSTIANEVDILTSGDVSMRAAEAVGPAKILAMKGGGNNVQSAAGVVGSGLSVEPPRTAVLTVTFKHPDKTIVQPVLSAVLTNYFQKHLEVYLGDKAQEEKLSQKMEQVRLQLALTDEKLKVEKKAGNMPFPEEATSALKEQVTKNEGDLWSAKAELAEQQAMFPDAEKTLSTPDDKGAGKVPDADAMEDYLHTLESLQTFKKRQRECEDLGQKESHPTLAGILERIQRLSEKKQKLEKEFPSLMAIAASATRGSTNDPGSNILAAGAHIKILKSKVAALEKLRRELNTDAGQIMDIQPRIAQLMSQRNAQQKDYDFFAKNLDTIRTARGANLGAALDIGVVDQPSPPKIDYKKFLKLLGIALGGCVGMGFGLAFLIDIVLDRSIRRSSDVEKHLHMPVFLSIPDASWTGKMRWPFAKAANGNGAASSVVEVNADGEAQMAVTPWKPGADLQNHAEGLRERLLTYFEVNNLNLKKPKLVALTGCESGSGVTTLASGLAAALSKTGDGNVLLVDMKSEQGIAHSYSNGKKGCGLSDVLEPEGRAEALVQENLYLARIDDRPNDRVPAAMPSRFNSLVPRLKASDYDYIIFDMPPVSPTSITPRMASHMDIVLLVLESERTGQHKAAKASNLMKESRANVAAVLNKCRQHVPEALSQELGG
jgi:succinoglycan biosynthesis transport protein ExoP